MLTSVFRSSSESVVHAFAAEMSCDMLLRLRPPDAGSINMSANASPSVPAQVMSRAQAKGFFSSFLDNITTSCRAHTDTMCTTLPATLQVPGLRSCATQAQSRVGKHRSLLKIYTSATKAVYPMALQY
jgi:hypothetical protein